MLPHHEVATHRVRITAGEGNCALMHQSYQRFVLCLVLMNGKPGFQRVTRAALGVSDQLQQCLPVPPAALTFLLPASASKKVWLLHCSKQNIVTTTHLLKHQQHQ